MTPTRGPIESAKDSTSGKTLSVKVAGKYYSTKNWDFRTMIGQVIEFVPDVSEWQGNTITWINDYTTPPMTADDRMDMTMAQTQSAPASQPAPSGNNLAYLPMTSNLVAHAIAAGLVKLPTDIAPWAKAAFAAAKGLIEPAAANVMCSGTNASAAEFDDDIPF